MAQVEISNCMKGITIVHVGKRNFRVATASLPAEFSSHKDVYVRPYNKDDVIGDKKTESAKNNEEITLKLNIPRSLYGLILGRGGENIRQLRYETKTSINLPYNGPSIIIGTKDRAEIAKKRIEEIIESHNNAENEKSTSNTKIEDKKEDDVESAKESIKDNEEITLKLDIPRYLHGLIVGRRGENIRQLRYETKTSINVPSFNGDGPVTIIGAKDRAEMAKKRIEEIIKSHNNTINEKSINDTKIEDKKENVVENEQITLKFNVPRHLYGLIIGKGGSTLNQIRDETKAKVYLPNDGPVTIIGTKDRAEMAKKRIEDIIGSHNNTGDEKSANNKGIEDNKKENIESIRKSIKDNKEGYEDYITLNLDVPQSLHKFIIGRGGNTVNQIKTETKTKITVQQNEDIVTISGKKDGIEKAKKQIEDVIKSSIFKLPPTHFISLPLNDTHLQRKVETFKSDVLKLNLQDVDKSILINSHSLHITIGTLNLYRKEDIDGAVKLLRNLSTEINELIGTRTLVAMLSGLSVMDNDPARAHVLYAKVEEREGQNTLKQLGEYLIDKFAEAGYLKKENRPLKLHVTLINTRHRDDDSASSHNNKNNESNRYPFNAVKILNTFTNIDFGSNRLENIHISKIGEYDENGRHHSEGGIKLP